MFPNHKLLDTQSHCHNMYHLDMRYQRLNFEDSRILQDNRILYQEWGNMILNYKRLDSHNHFHNVNQWDMG